MNRIYTLIFFTTLSSITIAGSANTESEVQHLLRFIENSNCIFIRNNDEHTSKKAKSHIEKKYNYYKSKISSAEDFIKYSATKSSMSGKFYKVRCNGNEQTSSQWLLDELATFRDQE